jgi:hypothetical protein
MTTIRSLMPNDIRQKNMSENDKTFRGNASQFFIAGELCRRGYAAVVTLGNTTDPVDHSRREELQTPLSLAR